MSHELRRTREKLKLLEETPYIQWVLGDIIDLTLDYMFGEAPLTQIEKVQVMRKLKDKYQEFIKENSSTPLRQGKLRM
jgi:hypothetical protein